jgi:hypothetical protein
MIESIIAAALLAGTPAIISTVTGLIKTLPTFEEAKTHRRPLIRFLAAAVSLVYIIILFWMTGGDVDTVQIGELLTVMVGSFIAWLSSLGWYHGLLKE